VFMNKVIIKEHILKDPKKCKKMCKYLKTDKEQENIIYGAMIYIPKSFITEKQFDDGF